MEFSFKNWHQKKLKKLFNDASFAARASFFLQPLSEEWQPVSILQQKGETAGWADNDGFAAALWMGGGEGRGCYVQHNSPSSPPPKKKVVEKERKKPFNRKERAGRRHRQSQPLKSCFRRAKHIFFQMFVFYYYFNKIW